jgi:SPP1 gp7 family putative phage head morphogenesis protein
MKQILMSDWSGANWSERLWKDRQIVGKKLTNILEKGIPQGTSLQKMSRELRDITGNSFNNAFRLIRTETSHIDGQVTLEGYKQAGEELGLEYYEYDAFLDTRTSSICRDLDKKRFKVSEAEVGVNYPPMHPNCRSTTQLVLDEEYKQQEIQYKEMSQKSIKESKEQVDKLSKDEKKALTAYTTDDFSAINHSLRTGEKNARVEDTIKNITSGLEKCSLPQNAILYRGIGTNAIENLLTKDVQNIMNMGLEKKLTEEQIKTFCGILKGKHFEDDAFISSSYDSKSAFDKPIRLNIFAKKGSKCGVIEDISIKPQEKEVLIQKGAKFEIKKAEFKNKTWILDVDLL